MNHFIFLTMVLRADGTVTRLLILVCIHKSYIVYLNYCADRSWIFIFWSWKINVEKEEAPWAKRYWRDSAL